MASTLKPGIKQADIIEPAEDKSSFFQSITEDWWAVIIATPIIAGVLILYASNIHVSLPTYKWSSSAELYGSVLSAHNLLLIVMTGLLFLALSGIAVRLSGASLKKYAAGFAVIYPLAVISLIIAGNASVNEYGLEYVVFALIIGLLVGNLTKVPEWLKTAARSEFFIKTGLVILGSSILFTDIVKAGFPGIMQAVIVVSVVWFFAMWLSRRLKVDDEFGVILSSAVAICGVSAAIVASGAIKGDKTKLSYVTTLVLLVAIPMLVLQPWMIRYFNIPEVVGGAWLGGTLDTTASVTAAAQLVGPAALKAGVIVKFSQNVLIGIAAFFIALWWTYTKKAGAGNGREVPGLTVVWERFPKFVLGFLAASLLFSFALPAGTVTDTAPLLNALRTVWFALAFVSIGLEARFSELVSIGGGRPALAFVVAQLFNILWTLLLSYLLFGGWLFAPVDIR